MPVEYNIYGNMRAPDILGGIKEGQQIKKNRMESQALEAEALKKQKIQAAYTGAMGPDGKVDQTKLVSEIGKVDGEKALNLGRDFKKDGDQDLERQMKGLEVQGQLLGSSNDQASWTANLEKAKAMGVDTTGIPDYYDENFKNVALGRTLKAKEQLDIKWREQEAQRAQGNSDRDFGMATKKFEQDGNQFQQTFGLQKDQFGYNKQKDQRDFGYNKEKDRLDYGLKKEKLEQDKADASGITVGRKEVDKQFGKTYEDWTSSGRPAVDKNLERLNNAIAMLESDDSLSGPAKALVPDKLRAFTNPKALSVRDDVRAAAQGALKATLGAQFTEKEGERIMNQAYNEALSPAENVKKIKAAIAELQAQRDMNERKSAYFQQRGTLTGFDGTSSGASMAAKNLESLPDDELDALFNQLQGK